MKTLPGSWALALVIAGAATAAAGAGEPYPLVQVTPKVHVIYGPFGLPDRDNRGFRNNPVVVSTSAGFVIFDPGGSAWAGEMVVERVRRLGPDPVVAVFNSHAHGDHWLGNEGVRRHFPRAAIYGHPRMIQKAAGEDGRQWLVTIERLTEGSAGGKRVTPPERAVRDGEVVTIGDTRFRVFHPGAAHTDNDIMIEVVGEDLLLVGDIARNGLLGIMESDASFSGNLEAIDAMLARGFRHYVPGHGPVGGPEILAAYRDYLATVLGTVKSLYGEGLADYEMKPKVLEKVQGFRNWAGFEMRLGAHVSRAFLEVEAESF